MSKKSSLSKLIFLGTGTSDGVPMIGCDCEVCGSDDPKDTRLRTAAYIITPRGARILIDAGPDFRIQALKNNIRWIDGILITHGHYDHVGGIDELRRINFIMKSGIDVFGNQQSLSEIKGRFSYIFNESAQKGGGKPKIELNQIDAFKEFFIKEQKALPIDISHGNMPILGYAIGDLAYITDASSIPDKTIDILKNNTETLVINALRYRPHLTHFNIEQALEIIDIIRPKIAYLVHATHDIKHSSVSKALPDGVYYAYDNLEITFHT